jgi:hypothetical protein
MLEEPRQRVGGSVTAEIFHALGLHLHQPPGNMLDVLRGAEHEAVGIIHAYDRIARCDTVTATPLACTSA